MMEEVNEHEETKFLREQSLMDLMPISKIFIKLIFF